MQNIMHHLQTEPKGQIKLLQIILIVNVVSELEPILRPLLTDASTITCIDRQTVESLPGIKLMLNACLQSSYVRPGTCIKNKDMP